MKNQIMRAYATAPASLELPADMDYVELLTHVLFDRADIGWAKGQVGQVPAREHDQPMIGFPGPSPRDNRLRGRICLVDRDDQIIPAPDHDARWAEIEARVDELGPDWFDATAPSDWALLMPGSAISKLPFTVSVEETFLYYAFFRHLRVGAERVVHRDGFGFNAESVEQHLRYCLCAKMDEHGASLQGLCDHAASVIAEGKSRFPRAA